MSGIPAGAGSLLGKRLGKYEILALLALGGTAEIYLARIGGAAGFEKYVVVKCLHDHLADDAEFVKMFLDEARLAAHLDHSNIVQTMELGEHEHRYYMVMEFLAGLSLAMIVRRAAERLPGGRIPVPLVLNMVAQSCAGMHYAHERVMNGKPLNIVHRDISPQNLVVSFEGVVKLVDFGIAKAELRETRTQSGTIKGKFAYMSPEQCVANNVDRRTDVFALGVIAHELLTGRRLFKKASAYETYQAVIECAVEPPSQLAPDIDPELDPIVMRAVAKDREQRYPTAEAFGDAILGFLHHRGRSSGPGDVSRWFDTSFAQEIEEHGARMRELISGRAPEAGPNWGGDDEEKKPEVAEGQDKSMILGAQDLEEVDPPASSSLSAVIGELGGAGDDMPAERTRIEANPLARISELDVDSSQSNPDMETVALPSSGGLPPGVLPTPLPAAPARPPQPAAPRPQAKFPNAANLPTMIAQPDPESG
ncbi:MAG TPA: serine/threonine-protein kinase, partial [Kofleriaceae bacterium]|nr:serine/threonine-protein kinase [Kofleriaceae bacterium]